MALTPELIASLTALLVAGLTGLATWRKDARLAKKDELEALRDRVDELVQRELVQQDYILQLRAMMINAGLHPPPLPPILRALQNQHAQASKPKPRKRSPWARWE